MGLSGQENWSGLPCPPPGIFLEDGFTRYGTEILTFQKANYVYFRNVRTYQVGTNVIAVSDHERESESHSVVSDSLCPRGLYSPWTLPGQSTGVRNLSLLQGFFPPQGSNPGLLHCEWILYQLSHKGSTLDHEFHINLYSEAETPLY